MAFQESMGPYHHHHHHHRGSGEMDRSERWVIAGIPLRAPLEPIYTNPMDKDSDTEEDCSITPTGEGSRIPTKVTCPPPPPKKRKPSLKYRLGGTREFFKPPNDLESVFVRRAEKAI